MPARWNCWTRAASPTGSSGAGSRAVVRRAGRHPRPRHPARPLPDGVDRAPEWHGVPLEETAREFGVPIHRGAEVVGLGQDDDQVRLELRGRMELPQKAAYVVGTDGAHSAVRRLSAWTSPAAVRRRTSCWPTSACPTAGRDPLRRDTKTAWCSSCPSATAVRAIAGTEPRGRAARRAGDARRAARSFRRIAGDDYGMGEPRWRTRFLSERRQAASYRAVECSSRATPPTCTPPSAAKA